MRRVNLDHIKTRGAGATSRAFERADHLSNIFHGHRAWRRIDGAEWRIGWADGAPPALPQRHDPRATEGSVLPALSAGMRELDPHAASLALDEPGDPRQRPDMRVVPDTEIFGADPAVWSDRACLRKDQARTADRAA